MNVTRNRSGIFGVIGALIVTSWSSSPVLAQDDYPTSGSIRSGARMHERLRRHATFDLNPGETQDLVSLKQPEKYRVCTIGKKSEMIADGEAHSMDHGDCVDIEASVIKMNSDDAPGETSGYYHQVGQRAQ